MRTVVFVLGMRDLAQVLPAARGLDLGPTMSASAISDDGNTIVGWVNTGTEYRTFVVDLQAVPEPGAMLVLAAAGLLLRSRARQG